MIVTELQGGEENFWMHFKGNLIYKRVKVFRQNKYNLFYLKKKEKERDLQVLAGNARHPTSFSPSWSHCVPSLTLIIFKVCSVTLTWETATCPGHAGIPRLDSARELTPPFMSLSV